LSVQESIVNAEIHDGFGIVQLSGEKLGEKQKHCKASVKELEARPWDSLFSS